MSTLLTDISFEKHEILCPICNKRTHFADILLNQCSCCENLNYTCDYCRKTSLINPELKLSIEIYDSQGNEYYLVFDKSPKNGS